MSAYLIYIQHVRNTFSLWSGYDWWCLVSAGSNKNTISLHTQCREISWNIVAITAPAIFNQIAKTNAWHQTSCQEVAKRNKTNESMNKTCKRNLFCMLFVLIMTQIKCLPRFRSQSLDDAESLAVYVPQFLILTLESSFLSQHALQETVNTASDSRVVMTHNGEVPHNTDVLQWVSIKAKTLYHLSHIKTL